MLSSVAAIMGMSTAYATGVTTHTNGGRTKTVNGVEVYEPASDFSGSNQSQAQASGATSLYSTENSANTQYAHTNIELVQNVKKPQIAVAKTQAVTAPDPVQISNGKNAETPASLACVYNLVPRQTSDCNPLKVTTTSNLGKGQTVAIVDAGSDSNVQANLDTYSKEFNLPSTQIQIVPMTSNIQDLGWSDEIDLDVQSVHALLPQAHIILVEAASANDSDLYAAVQKASDLVSQAGGGVVSMSWGGQETSADSQQDNDFTTPNVVYVASTGDDGRQSGYPATSPNVVAAGGTAIVRSNAEVSQIAWDDGGGDQPGKGGGSGGTSQYEPEPSYQSSNQQVNSIVNGKRGTPDISANADEVKSPIAIYSQGKWIGIGGTSEAAPLLAAMIASQGVSQSTNALLGKLYSAQNINNIYDVTSGDNQLGESAGKGYDLVTGLGTPNALSAF